MNRKEKKFDASLTVAAVCLFNADAVAFQKSEDAAKKAGVALRAVQKAKPEGGFTKWIRENLGKGEAVRQRVYYCLRVAFPVRQEAGAPNREWLRISKGFKALRVAAERGNIGAAQKAADKIRGAVDEMLAQARHEAKEEKAAAAAA